MRTCNILILALVFSASAIAQSSSCITSIKDIPSTKQQAPDDVRRNIPAGGHVLLVLPLSSSDTLTIYQMGGREEDGPERGDPDTRLLISRKGAAVFRYAMKELVVAPGDRKWGSWVVAVKAAHLCSNSDGILYVVFQAGNQGGYVLAIKAEGEKYRLVPLMPLTQGRIVLSVNSPYQVTAWTVTPEDAQLCTGCGKHYLVKTLDVSRDRVVVVRQSRTEEKYSSFQDQPLVVNGE